MDLRGEKYDFNNIPGYWSSQNYLLYRFLFAFSCLVLTFSFMHSKESSTMNYRSEDKPVNKNGIK